MRVVYEAGDLIDAHLVKGRLENEGVPAWVRGEHLTGGIGQLPVHGLLAVLVADSDAEEAQAHLARWAAERADDRGEDVTGDEGFAWDPEPDPAV